MSTKIYLHVVFCFALCTNQAAAQLDETKPFMGLTFISAADARPTLEQMDVPARQLPKDGLLVLDVMASAAAQGAKPLDLITHINRRPVKTEEQIHEILATLAVGDTVDVGFKRFSRVWRTSKGTFTLTTQRKAYYDSLNVSHSQVNNTYRASLAAFSPGTSYIAPIIVVADNKPRLFVEVNYRGRDWLFVNKVTVVAGSKRASFSVGLGDRDDEVLRGEVSERMALPMPEELLDILRNAAGDQMLARIDGSDRYVENDLSKEWLAQCRMVLAIYDDLVATGDLSYLAQRAQ